ncbi:MAG TPA: hypothetical protein VHG91_05105 [Longimicrobium sp.]|nr:hypothetical protein [Longimicrobium sp.]
MSRRGRIARLAAVALLVVAGSAAAELALGARDRAATPIPERLSSPTTAEYDASTIAVDGELSPAARADLAPHTRDGRALVVVLRGRDRLTCEDLGRQLREAKQQAGDSHPIIVMTDSADVDAYRGFLRRERVRAPIVPFAPDALLPAEGPLPTPAVLVTHDSARSAAGVAHPRRFPNVRLRSFADEVSPLLRGRFSTPLDPEVR